MRYQDIWTKVLGADEKVEYEFSIGEKYRKFGIIIWAIISLPLLLAAGLGVFTFLAALFFYGFYSKWANAYAFTNKRVIVHQGWLSTKTISIDYAKITDVHVVEPFIDRLLTQTGHLSINTAGTATNEVLLKHITTPYEVKKQLDLLKDSNLNI